MSFADSINGFKKTYATEYRDNNKCPYDETIENLNSKTAELIKFSNTNNHLTADSYIMATFSSSIDKDFEKEDKDFETLSNFEDEEECNIDERYIIKENEKNSNKDYLEFDS